MQVNAALTYDGEKQIDLYSHAYTCVIGQHALIVHDFNCPVNFGGYDPSKWTMTPKCLKVSEAVAYDCHMKVEVFIIEFHQDILIYHFHNNILCPMQMSMYDVKVNDIPKYLPDKPTD